MLDKLKKLDHILGTTPEERRREVREELINGKATIAGLTYELKNWSAKGFCISPYLFTPKPGDRLDIAFTVPLPEGTLEFKCRTGVMRFDAEKQEIGGVFFDVDEATRDAIDAHFQVFSTARYGRGLLQNLKTALGKT